MFTMAALYFKLYVESHHHDNYGFFGPILLLLTFVNMIIDPLFKATSSITIIQHLKS